MSTLSSFGLAAGDSRPSVAVIGAGAAGLVALKNLREVGLDAFAFEQRTTVGGLWCYTDDPNITTAVPTTVTNVSKQMLCYTDFPFSDEAPNHPTQSDMAHYFNAYAVHFNLLPYIRFGVIIRKISRNASDSGWIIRYQEQGSDDENAVEVSKVVLAHGQHTTPNIPKIAGIELFKGTIAHSRAFKRPEPYKNQNVVVIGCSNTAADVATSLVGHASKIYLSHRRGARMMPRTIKGKPSDHAITHRQRVLNHFFDSMYPSFSENTMNLLCSAISYFMYSSLPSKWGFDDPPSMFQHPPVVSENLVSDMHNGSVEPVPGIKRIVGGRSIELTDGSVIDVDAIVFATGYRPNFSLIEVDGDEYDFRQLYRSIFPLKYSKSLAFAGFGITLFPALAMYDLSAMYISQVFAGLTSLPSRDIMQSVVMKQEKWRLDRLAQRGGSSGVTEGIFPLGPWLADLATTLGLGLDENLGYGVEGWKFWWQDRKFCDVLMGGLDSPHIYRVFDGEGKRKIWEGARAEICKVNGVAPL